MKKKRPRKENPRPTLTNRGRGTLRVVVRDSREAVCVCGAIVREEGTPKGSGLPFRRWERFAVTGAGAFGDGVDGVGGDVLQSFGGAIGPADFHGVHFRGGAEAEMQAEIVL